MINVPFDVKKALRKGIYRNEYRINVLNDDGTTDFTIDNSSLISESVNIDERMCSGDVLKFGLCEGSSLEFQYFDNPNLYGRRLQVFIDVGFTENLYWTIPMGFFEVKKCSRQADTGIMKVTAYNKLQSEYLDTDAKNVISDIVSNGEYGYTDKVSIYTILKDLLDEYGIEEESYSDTSVPFGVISGCNYDTIPLCDADGTPMNINMYLYTYGVGTYLNADDFYYFNLHLKDIQDFAKENIWGINTHYTKVNGVVYSLEDLASQSFIESYRLSGSMYCRKKVDVNTFFFHYKGGDPDLVTDEYSECWAIDAEIPVHVSYGTTPPTISPIVWENYYQNTWGADYKFVDIFKKNIDSAQKIRLTTAEIETISNVTLRDLQSAVYELQCQYGQLDRETDLFSGVELNKGGLYPREDLYPANNLYPSGASLSGDKSMYSKLWADEGNVRKWRKLIITYKGLDENNNPTDLTLERTIDANGTDDYIMSDNWLMKNLIWTAADVGDYADAMVAKMQDVTWFPFEMWCAGLPYLETGDMIEIPLEDKHYTSYVLQRQLKGIQNLQDTYINGTLDIF